MQFSIFYLLVLVVSVHCKQASHKVRKSYKANPPNIIEILVDDLGYGDTGLEPFVGLGVKTPNMVRMAEKGTILTNYHTAAATCSPTRASILTGMYPWRIGIKGVFEYGAKIGGNRNDWLPPLPTIPMVLREANYTVFHSGKWHLGGMRNDDWDLRQLPQKLPSEKGGKRCPHPGPNQQGFKNYVSMLDGPGSPRQNRLQIPRPTQHLYSEGCSALLHNDVDIGQGQYNISGYLSYCEAEHAIQAVTRSVAKKKPFFVQLWFHAPHAPLEGIPGYPEYMKRDIKIGAKRPDGSIPYRTENVSLREMGPTYQYRSMIADMDHQLGRILSHIEALGIESNTLVVFTSDNGPENSAGTTAGFKGNKRYIYEGGIRVPAIVQWVGTIPAGQVSDMFAVSTDLFPTILDAAGVQAPSHLRLDGLSLLPQLVPNYYTHNTTSPISAKTEAGLEKHVVHPVDEIKDNPELYRAAMRDRVTLWHNDYEGPRRTAAWVYDFKVILDEAEQMREIYDMRVDKYEKKNLFYLGREKFWGTFNSTLYAPGLTEVERMAPLLKEVKQKITLQMVETDRANPLLHLWISGHLFKPMQDFARGGNAAHALFMQAHPGWSYPPTAISDYRSDNIRGALVPLATGKGAAEMKSRLINDNCGDAPCTCEVKLARNVPTLPFDSCKPFAYLSPGRLINGAKLLGL